jgi:hypothetical protein
MPVVNKKVSGFVLTAEFEKVPCSFVNGIRRILNSETPILRLANIVISENGSAAHSNDIVAHRLGLLPIARRHTSADWDKLVIKCDVKAPADEPRYVLSSDLTWEPEGGVPIVPGDRDFGDAHIISHLLPGEALKFTAGLEVWTGGSYTIKEAMSVRPDPELAEPAKKAFVEAFPQPKRAQAAVVFDNHHAQTYGNPAHPAFKFTLESGGLVEPNTLLQETLVNFQNRVEAWFTGAAKDNLKPAPSNGPDAYEITSPDETWTVLSLVRDVLIDLGPKFVHVATLDQTDSQTRMKDPGIILRIGLPPPEMREGDVKSERPVDINGVLDRARVAITAMFEGVGIVADEH